MYDYYFYTSEVRLNYSFQSWTARSCFICVCQSMELKKIWRKFIFQVLGKVITTCWLKEKVLTVRFSSIYLCSVVANMNIYVYTYPYVHYIYIYKCIYQHDLTCFLLVLACKRIYLFFLRLLSVNSLAFTQCFEQH